MILLYSFYYYYGWYKETRLDVWSSLNLLLGEKTEQLSKTDVHTAFGNDNVQGHNCYKDEETFKLDVLNREGQTGCQVRNGKSDKGEMTHDYLTTYIQQYQSTCIIKHTHL